MLIFHGNDTIDPYPPSCKEIEKILCVSEKTFKAIVKDVEVFFKGIKVQAESKSLIKDQCLESNELIKPFSSAFKNLPDLGHFEPSNIIYLQYTDIRRWRRVNEWFSQYAPYGAEE